MKKLLTCILLFLLSLCLFACDDEGDFFNDCIESESNTKAKQELNAKSATILIYMIASDLESEAGCASTDIEEMCNASIKNNLNIVIETGGSKYWENDQISASQVQRFEIKKGKLKKVETVGKAKKINMASKDTLSSFIRWGIKKYPADRYGMILWNHGGGSVMGYGYDEYHPDSSLSLIQMRKAFKEAKDKTGVVFNFIGFDACLMGTVETAYAMHPYAKYMIASEEFEPGSGWYYTDWLTKLSENPGMSMSDLGKQIINDFVDGPDSSFWSDLTLSLYDLSDVKNLYKELCSYMARSRKVLKKQGFSQMAEARSDAKSYGDDEYEQVDMKSYMNHAELDYEKLQEVLEHMIVYYKGNVYDSAGIAMYYPYSYLDYYSDMYKTMTSIGMKNEDYLGYFNDFVNILSGGKNRSLGTRASTSLLEQLLDITQEDTSQDYSEEEWYNEETADVYFDDTALFSTDEDLIFTEKGDNYILDLTEEQWKSINTVEMLLYIKDGDGYGYWGNNDSFITYEKGSGDLIADYDYHWVAFDGQFVPYYTIHTKSNGKGWQSTGYVPAVLNEGTKKEQDIDIYIYWDSEHDDGYIMGYTPYKHDEDTISLANKNYLQLKKGDTLDFYCDFYDGDGKFDDTYYVGDTFKLTSDETKVSYEEFDDDVEVEFGYRLTDYYQNEYWTEIFE